MIPIPEQKFNQAVDNLTSYGFIQKNLDGSISITDKGDAYLERMMNEKSEMFILLFLFFLQSEEQNG